MYENSMLVLELECSIPTNAYKKPHCWYNIQNTS